ncbi:MAG: hypothetical protein GQ470_06170 [Gammaproteobacteria bacterium]|nr:hypothetical protein [Gammaproteobacteria bacterium]
MKYRHWVFAIFGLFMVMGCSRDDGNAKKLIIEAFDKSAAVHFVEFTQYDDTTACYEVGVRNYDGREQTVFISLKKDNIDDQKWSRWATAENFEDCRNAIK